jgi:hypothetical protein
MSCAKTGRLLTAIRNVITPASSFDTVTPVMSGAATSSPVEST